MKNLCCQKSGSLTCKKPIVFSLSLLYGFFLSLLLFFIYKNRKNRTYRPTKNEYDVIVLPKPEIIIDSSIAGINPHDDLKIILGIGPIISEYLKSIGILTFKELSERDPSDLQALLTQRNIRLNNADTWTHQAKLASDNKWEELKIYQSKIKQSLRK